MKEFLLSACATLFIYDGDNVRCDGVTYRLTHVNTPEIRGQCPSERELAKRSRDRLRALAKDPTAKLTEVLCYGSNFGRRCGIVTVKGVDVALVLINEGLGENYSCGSKGCPKRRNWCG